MRPSSADSSLHAQVSRSLTTSLHHSLYFLLRIVLLHTQRHLQNPPLDRTQQTKRPQPRGRIDSPVRVPSIRIEPCNSTCKSLGAAVDILLGQIQGNRTMAIVTRQLWRRSEKETLVLVEKVHGCRETGLVLRVGRDLFEDGQAMHAGYVERSSHRAKAKS